MANNFRLPTSQDSNWGEVLNAYVQNLDNKIKSLETKYASLDQQSAIKNIGYASSGIVGKSICKCNDDGKGSASFSFTGNVFISGDVNTYYTLENLTGKITGLTPDTAYYIFLNHYDGMFDFIARSTEEFQSTYTAILLGFLYSDAEGVISFVPYYDSSLKTIMEVQYELQSRWVDLEITNSLFSITIDESILPTNAICGDYLFYCNGLATDSISKFYTPSNNGGYIKIKPTANIITLEDYQAEDKDANKTYITTERKPYSAANTDGNYFRILLNIFGHIIVQRSYQNGLLKGDGLLREQQLLNARFNNDLHFLNPTLWVEVARFGYNKDEVEEGIYHQDYSKEGFKMFEKITFVRSITNGLAAQQSPRIWVANDSKIDLTKTTFIQGANDVDGFKVEYSGPKTTLKIDRSKASSDTLLFTKSNEDVQFGNVEILEDCNIQFTSDRRSKDNFAPIEESYLSVVENVPVLNYTYLNSTKPQVGIIAQDLEATNIPNMECFVNVHETIDLPDKRCLYETKLIYILWKALQEETELRKKLEKRVEDLEAK